MKTIIEVSGGNIVNIVSSDPISIVIIDWDNIKTGDIDLSPWQPDCIAAYEEPLYEYIDEDSFGVREELKKRGF